MYKVCHLTSVHPRYDTRIFVKECASLVRAGYLVTLIVADGKGDEMQRGVHIVDVFRPVGGRAGRMTKTVRAVYQKALEVDAALYHFHDPELIPAALMLKRKGKKVIYDVHEDVPRQIAGKQYLKRWQKAPLSGIFERFENYAARKFDHIVTATPHIRDRFLQLGAAATDINNFPLLDELECKNAWDEKEREVCYIGSIAQIRGIKELVRAMEHTGDVRLNLVGSFSERDVEREVKEYVGWSKVNDYGFRDRDGVAEVLHQSMGGIVTLHPTVNYLDALPVKMFEYMSAGIPVIASDFPLWRDIVEKNRCGICVDPLDPEAIANAIDYIVTHPEEAEAMGRNGRTAVETRYNWMLEEAKLLKIYGGLLHD